MNKRHYEHTLPNIRGSLSNTYLPRAGNRTKGQQIDDVHFCTSSICFLEVLPMSIIIFVIVKKN